MRDTIKAVIHRDDTYYFAECLDIDVATQGTTLQETITSLREAIILFLEKEGAADFYSAPSPSLQITLELGPAGISLN
jgi:predicted RNase H-like HicB family nuclease